MSRHWCSILLLFLVILISPARGAEASLRKVNFSPQWSAQAQFAGYYMARSRGFYRQRGIDLTIVNCSPEDSSARLLAHKKVHFSTIQLSTAIVLSDRGSPVVNIAQLHQHSGLMFVAKKASGILSPRDMAGKKIGLWQADSRYEAELFLKKYSLNVEVIPQSYTVNLFLRGGVDVASATLYNELHRIIDAGYDAADLVEFPFSGHGMDYPQDGIYARKDLVAGDPALCRAFVEASLEGWRYAFTHEDETISLVLGEMKKAYLPASRAHQTWMLRKIKMLMAFDTRPDTHGTLDPGQFNALSRALKENGLITRLPSYIDFYQFCGDHAAQ